MMFIVCLCVFIFRLVIGANILAVNCNVSYSSWLWVIVVTARLRVSCNINETFDHVTNSKHIFCFIHMFSLIFNMPGCLSMFK